MFCDNCKIQGLSFYGRGFLSPTPNSLITFSTCSPSITGGCRILRCSHFHLKGEFRTSRAISIVSGVNYAVLINIGLLFRTLLYWKYVAQLNIRHEPSDSIKGWEFLGLLHGVMLRPRKDVPCMVWIMAFEAWRVCAWCCIPLHPSLAKITLVASENHHVENTANIRMNRIARRGEYRSVCLWWREEA